MIEKMKERYDGPGKPENKPEYFAPIDEIMSNIVSYYDQHKSYTTNLQDFQKKINK